MPTKRKILGLIVFIAITITILGGAIYFLQPGIISPMDIQINMPFGSP
ncbi:hypothetical protein KAJ41_00095 [Candidatus Parcubacteria bacterium]|nr:hypothetical protein [Candidatus Parcubacteria bacterium]